MTAYQHIEGWRYPDGVRLTVNFTIDFDAQLFRGGRTDIWQDHPRQPELRGQR